MSDTGLLTLAQVESARERIASRLPPTPLRRSFALRAHDAWLKLECWQPTGSFKVRGATNFIASLSAEQRRFAVSTIASTTGCSWEGDRLMTLSTSLVAVWYSSDS